MMAYFNGNYYQLDKSLIASIDFTEQSAIVLVGHGKDLCTRRGLFLSVSLRLTGLTALALFIP